MKTQGRLEGANRRKSDAGINFLPGNVLSLPVRCSLFCGLLSVLYVELDELTPVLKFVFFLKKDTTKQTNERKNQHKMGKFRVDLAFCLDF